MPAKRPCRISDYRIDQEKLEAILGPLESRVMKTIWSMPETSMSVREVHSKMIKDGQLAYTTVMSTMNTLHSKGILERRLAKGRGGLYYVYRPKFAQGDFERSAVRQVIDSLTRNFGDSVTSYLIEKTISDKNLNSLKKALDEKRRDQVMEKR